MTVRKIRIWPDPALSEVAKPVENVDDEIRTLVDDMFETMYKANGIGLAATQIAVPHRVLVIDLDPSKEAGEHPDLQAELDAFLFKGPQEFINPKIIEREGSIVWEEGCLSIPGYTDKVTRSEWVEVEALDRNGEAFKLEAAGLFAVCLQHEIDHLNGKVFVQHLSKLKRDSAKRKMTKLIKSGIDDGVEAAAHL